MSTILYHSYFTINSITIILNIPFNVIEFFHCLVLLSSMHYIHTGSTALCDWSFWFKFILCGEKSAIMWFVPAVNLHQKSGKRPIFFFLPKSLEHTLAKASFFFIHAFTTILFNCSSCVSCLPLTSIAVIATSYYAQPTRCPPLIQSKKGKEGPLTITKVEILCHTEAAQGYLVLEQVFIWVNLVWET